MQSPDAGGRSKGKRCRPARPFWAQRLAELPLDAVRLLSGPGAKGSLGQRQEIGCGCAIGAGEDARGFIPAGTRGTLLSRSVISKSALCVLGAGAKGILFGYVIGVGYLLPGAQGRKSATLDADETRALDLRIQGPRVHRGIDAPGNTPLVAFQAHKRSHFQFKRKRARPGQCKPSGRAFILRRTDSIAGLAFGQPEDATRTRGASRPSPPPDEFSADAESAPT